MIRNILFFPSYVTTVSKMYLKTFDFVPAQFTTEWTPLMLKSLDINLIDPFCNHSLTDIIKQNRYRMGVDESFFKIEFNRQTPWDIFVLNNV